MWTRGDGGRRRRGRRPLGEGAGTGGARAAAARGGGGRAEGPGPLRGRSLGCSVRHGRRWQDSHRPRCSFPSPVAPSSRIRANCVRSNGEGVGGMELSAGNSRWVPTSARGILSRMLVSPSTVKQSSSAVRARSCGVHWQRWLTLKTTFCRRLSDSFGITPNSDAWSIRVELIQSGVINSFSAISASIPRDLLLSFALDGFFFLASGRFMRLTITGILADEPRSGTLFFDQQFISLILRTR